LNDPLDACATQNKGSIRSLSNGDWAGYDIPTVAAHVGGHGMFEQSRVFGNATVAVDR
jgi:hypothetical protein